MNESCVVIADDEPLARKTLREHLQTADWIGEIHEAAHGLAAMRLIDDLRPALVFLDVQMPGASGIEVAQQIAYRPYIVFTTAYDRYAVTAFEIGALDYLLKPFGRDRVMTVLDRARTALRNGAPAILARASQGLGPKPLSHVFVKERDRMIAVALDRVERLEACDDYVALCIDGRRHLLYARLYDLLERLDPDRFIRVHRSFAVNLSFVKSIEPGDGSRLVVVMKSGTRVPASRTGAANLKALRFTG
ncbi:MAG TPA: LytTR family DNA-binding domain-containing protein [Vicinamibacterales bacterium]|jgi:two-component system LytT family response regulator